MAIEDWLDDLTALWEIGDGHGGKIHSYRYFDGIGMPESINDYPSAVTFPENFLPAMSVSLKFDYWRGRTEFHLFEDAGYDKLPEVVKYAARIRDAIASDTTLAGKVSEFRIDPDRPRILIPAQLRWSETLPWHWGAVVYWEVKEETSSDYTYST